MPVSTSRVSECPDVILTTGLGCGAGVGTPVSTSLVSECPDEGPLCLRLTELAGTFAATAS